MLGGQREKSWASACPKCHRFGGLVLGISAFSMSARLGADLRSLKAGWLWMGQMPPLCMGDQGPEVRSLEGRRAGALCTFTTVDKQQPVYFAPIIPFLTNLFGY